MNGRFLAMPLHDKFGQGIALLLRSIKSAPGLTDFIGPDSRFLLAVLNWWSGGSVRLPICDHYRKIIKT